MDFHPTSDSSLPSSSPAKRPVLARTPSLLPAFEPQSSSPIARPRSSKRKFDDDEPVFPKVHLNHLPTPIPTSSTGVLPSSPPARTTRPGLQRTASQRCALAALDIVDLPADGRTLRMGRSSGSCDYQLGINRFISRVHVEGTYHAPSASCPYGRVVIQCLAVNGVTVHCGGQMYQIKKGQSFTSEVPSEDIMLDVQDSRVMIAWPYVPRRASFSFHSDVEDSPSRRVAASPQHAFASSPPRMPQSPLSPSPAQGAASTFLASDFGLHNPIKVFEDPEPEEDVAVESTEVQVKAEPNVAASRSQTGSPVKSVLSSSLSSLPPDDDLSDRDEENDPIVHSFGPFGDNVLARMANFSHESPKTNTSPLKRRKILHPSLSSPEQRTSAPRANLSPIKNHVVNQLAFSRLHSMPLSTIHSNLPAELKSLVSTGSSSKNAETDGEQKEGEFTAPELKSLLDSIPCVGQIAREGKDAAGKPLENEFYYVPEMDTDAIRKNTVTGGLGKTGLRAVRKNHKQYYWKKPRF